MNAKPRFTEKPGFLLWKIPWVLAVGLVATPVRALAQVPGGSVVYCRVNLANQKTSIWIAAVDGSSDVRLTDGFRAHLSLDRRSLVFERDGARGFAYGARGDVWVRDLVSNTEALVYNNNDYVVGADFARDASQVIFDYGSGNYLVNRDGSGFTTLSFSLFLSHDDAPVVNPVDGRVAMHNTYLGLIVGTELCQDKRVVANTVLGVYPHWSADGQWLSYANQLQTDEYSGHNLFKIRPDGADRLQLTFFPGGANSFPNGAVWTADGSALIGAGNIDGVNGIYRVSSDGSGTITLLNIITPGDPIAYVGAVVPEAGAAFAIDWFALDGGGGTSRGDVYAVSGSAGQPDGGESVSSGEFALEGGFWELPAAVQTYDGPFLSVTRSTTPDSFILSWAPDAPGFLLQSSDHLEAGEWIDVPGGGTNPISLSASSAARFYRLVKP